MANTKKEKKSAKKKELFVVGVGASAGGLDALTKLLSSLNGVNDDFCVVIVMHLSPKHKSELTSILGKRCKWPAITIENNIKMESGHVYVTPPNSNVHVEGKKLILDPLPENYQSAPSIDILFTSLAKTKKNKAVGIVLSGFGKDGSKGIVEIKKRNGFAIAQLPETAEHRDMPQAAIKTDMVDIVLPPEQIFKDVARFTTNSKANVSSPSRQKSIDAIFDLLEKRSGTNFSLYKSTTIMRRINLRVSSLNMNSLIEYYELLKTSPRELDKLFETVLIGVTEFFRDPEAFDSFKKHLQQVLQKKAVGDSIRIWCVGCATGEEPYSVAMMLHELLGISKSHHQIQIFASDIDEHALNHARKGVYRAESLENLDEELISKYFNDLEDGVHYEVTKQIKQHILFTRHDIGNDPPFVRLDAIICRNLLIYFKDNLKKKTFQRFHYSLRTHGILFLGKSESISVTPDLFNKAGTKKIFKKSETIQNYQLRHTRFRGATETESIDSQGKEIRNMSIVDVAKETLYHKSEYPFVIINDQAEIKQVHGSLRMYLEISEGTMNANLLKMANPELVTVLKPLLAKVKKAKVPHSSHIVKFKLYENLHYVRVKINPLIYPVGDIQYYLVLFEKITPTEQVLETQKKLETSDYVNFRIKELEEELATKSEHLQIFTEELEATNEELQTINEELQSANEELKSSNEELETSNEELQSANEELNTANNELRFSNEQLTLKEEELRKEKKQSDRNELIYRTIAENLPNGTVGILNKRLEIEYIAGQGLDELSARDLVGKVMPDLNPSKVEAERLRKLCEATLKGKSGSIEVRYNNNYYKVQTAPIKPLADEETKILYLVQDMTDQKNSLLKLDTALKAANIVIFEYDFEKDIIPPNKELCKFLEIGTVKALNQKDIEAKLHPDDTKIRRQAFKKAIKTGLSKSEGRFILKDGIKHVRTIGRVLFDDNKKPLSAIVSLLDITRDKELLYQAKDSEERFKTIAESAPVTIWMTDKDDMCTYINKNWLEYTGTHLQENLKDGWLKYIHPEDRHKAMQTFLNASEENEPFELEYMVKNVDGSYGWFVNRAHPMQDKDGNFAGFVGSNFEITEKKEFTIKLKEEVEDRTSELKLANDQLVKMNMNLEEYARITSHDLQEPVRKIRTFNSILKEQVKNDEDALKTVEKVEQSASRMSTLIKDILEYSQISEKGINFKKTDLDNILKNIEKDLELLIEEEDVQIKSNNLGNITAISAQIHQLFSNLIKNAIKFNERQPKITINAANVSGKNLPETLQSNGKKKFKKLTFEDNGIGIPKDQQEKIFKPFNRLHSKSTYPGTGLGLTLCRRIVEIHQGWIGVDKNKKGGTTFTVVLPVNQSDNPFSGGD